MKIAIFVEGLTEDIFVHALLEDYFNPGTIQIKSEKPSGKTRWISFKFVDDVQQYGEHFCLIVDASGDESVLSKLKENYDQMHQRGYTAFFGLRDVKSDAFDRFGERIIQSARDTADAFKTQNDVFLHFAKMEIEAWFLAEPKVFERIDSRLTPGAIEQAIGINLGEVDPQEQIPNPTQVVRRIHRLVGLPYRKKKSHVYRLVSRLDWGELCISARDKSHISYFFDFLADLERALITPSA